MSKQFDEATITASLREQGAKFAYVFGSRADSEVVRINSDFDVAAHWGGKNPNSWEINLPDDVDLVVLDSAPLWIAGRVAVTGRLLFDDDPPARVAWQADTGCMYLDELPALRERQREWREAVARGR
ncbi:MAG: nucleotidyltransferase domain-containing protein [Acidobacteria bacterium]|nr:MAG: nucleotidyltransferase domain-containing protein [Acidobacteriota bacterium]